MTNPGGIPKDRAGGGNLRLLWRMLPNVYPHLSGDDDLAAIHLEEVDRDFPRWCKGHNFGRCFVPAKVIVPNIVMGMK